jgi:hypothetical protein
MKNIKKNKKNFQNISVPKQNPTAMQIFLVLLYDWGKPNIVSQMEDVDKKHFFEVVG